MLENLLEDRQFAGLMKRHLQETMALLFEKEQNFGILCKVSDVTFEPMLPESMYAEFRELTLFFLAGYTFETARIESGMLIFEAGFGSENFGSVVSVPLLSILHVIVDETPIMINLAMDREEAEEQKEEDVDTKGVQNSMEALMSNPENQKFFK